MPNTSIENYKENLREDFEPTKYIKTYFIMSRDDYHLSQVRDRCIQYRKTYDGYIPEFERDVAYMEQQAEAELNRIMNPEAEQALNNTINKLRVCIQQFLDYYKIQKTQKYNPSALKNLKTSKNQINGLLTNHPQLQELMNDPVENNLTTRDTNFLDKFNSVTEQLKRKDNIKKQIKEALINRKK